MTIFGCFGRLTKIAYRMRFDRGITDDVLYARRLTTDDSFTAFLCLLRRSIVVANTVQRHDILCMRPRQTGQCYIVTTRLLIPESRDDSDEHTDEH